MVAGALWETTKGHVPSLESRDNRNNGSKFVRQCNDGRSTCAKEAQRDKAMPERDDIMGGSHEVKVQVSGVVEGQRSGKLQLSSLPWCI